MKNEKYNFLIIATSFAPQNRIGAIRTSKISKYLARQGHNVIVVAPGINNNEPVDRTLEIENRRNIVVYRITNGFLFEKTLRKIRNRMLRNRTAISYTNISSSQKRSLKNHVIKRGSTLYMAIENKLWELNVTKFINKRKILSDDTIIFSSYPKVSSHNIALNLRSQNRNKWIADFRDPMVYDELNSEKRNNGKYQDKFVMNADIISYVSENMINKLLPGDGCKGKFKYLPNGFDEDDLKLIRSSKIEPFSSKNVNLSYVGGLYNGKRDLIQLFQCIRSLIDNCDICINKIRFYYAGKEFNVLKKQAMEYKLEDILVNKGFIAREESLVIQQQSDIVVVSTWNTEKDVGVIPGKIYECFLLKKPTIIITNGTRPYSELGSMVKKAKLGIELNTMLEDKDEDDSLKKFILEAYKTSMTNSKFEVNYEEEYINKFNYKNITQQLIKSIEDINRKEV